MRTVIIVESHYGATAGVAEELARVARRHGEVEVVRVEDAGPDTVDGADLVLVGGPTHVHGMTWASTRRTADADAAERQGREPGIDAAGPGLRTWFHQVDRVHGTPSAAFDTRLDGPEHLTGRASLGISRRLRHHGFVEVAAPRSFLVDKENALLEGELGRAADWADSVFGSMPAVVH